MRKMKTADERKHMARVAQMPCIVCWTERGPHDPLPVELHHPRSGTGMGQRASHFDVIPLCVQHHRGNLGVHGLGVKGFEEHYGYSEADMLYRLREML